MYHHEARDWERHGNSHMKTEILVLANKDLRGFDSSVDHLELITPPFTTPTGTVYAMRKVPHDVGSLPVPLVAAGKSLVDGQDCVTACDIRQ